MTDQPYLVLFDADRIAGYVFETGRLKEIRGGSRIVRDVTRRRNIALLAAGRDRQAKVIFAGGGAGLVRLGSCDAADGFIADLQQTYRRETVSGALSAVKVVYPSGAFAETVEQANIALRRQKSSEPQHDGGFAANPFTAVCVSCGRRPAGGDYQTARGRHELLCAACMRRRGADDSLHQLAQGEEAVGDERRVSLDDLRERAGDELARAFLSLAGQRNWAGAWLPDELDHLGRLSRPANYLGFIHADGNRMGDHLHDFLRALRDRKLSDLELEDKYDQFSQAIAKSTVDALAEALHRAFSRPPESDDEARVPFDNVLLAGDDVILLVAAHQALDVAADFCTGFQQRMTAAAARLGYDRAITISAGVVLANASQPILYLRRQAEELLKRAKRLSAEKLAEGQPVSTVDFTVVTTPVLRPLQTIRDQDYVIRERDRKLRLTRRPYMADDLRDMLALGRRLKGVSRDENAPADLEQRSYPRSQLHALYEAIFQGYDQASLQGARALMRVSHHQQALLQQFADRFASNRPLPWGPAATDSADLSTAFTELVELHDFLHGTDGEEGTDE
jgi:hypothetical protein